MRTCRVTLAWMLVLAAVVLSVPAAALATGPSAGDNQYTDPLTNHHTHTTTTSSTSTPPPTSTGSSGTPTTQSPTATTASTTTTSTSTTASGKSSKSTLPRTGFPAALAAAIGFSLIGIGLVTRRRIPWSGR